MNVRAHTERILTDGRALALSRMTSRVTIRRKSGRTEDADGMPVDGWSVVASGVLFRLAGTASRGAVASRTVTIGGVETERALRVGHLPVDTALVDDDFLEVTSGENAGAVLRVIEASHADQQTALRVPVIETSRPQEW